jgi:hypothetical protein
MHRKPSRDIHSSHPALVVFETTNGRVTRRPDCGCFELRFGNALIGLRADELDELLAAIVHADMMARQDARGISDRTTVLTFHDTGCGWVFSAPEAEEMHRLVAGALLLANLPPSSLPSP